MYYDASPITGLSAQGGRHARLSRTVACPWGVAVIMKAFAPFPG
jgi:hypothetical protein